MKRVLLIVSLLSMIAVPAVAQVCQVCVQSNNQGTQCMAFGGATWQGFAVMSWRNCYVTLAPLGIPHCRVSLPCYNFDIFPEGDPTEYDIDPYDTHDVNPEDIVPVVSRSMTPSQYEDFELSIDRAVVGVSNPRHRARIIYRMYRTKLAEVSKAAGAKPGEVDVLPKKL
jgi:hypothetical protein